MMKVTVVKRFYNLIGLQSYLNNTIRKQNERGGS